LKQIIGKVASERREPVRTPPILVCSLKVADYLTCYTPSSEAHLRQRGEMLAGKLLRAKTTELLTQRKDDSTAPVKRIGIYDPTRLSSSTKTNNIKLLILNNKTGSSSIDFFAPSDNKNVLFSNKDNLAKQ
jgi:hypothetical protein